MRLAADGKSSEIVVISIGRVAHCPRGHQRPPLIAHRTQPPWGNTPMPALIGQRDQYALSITHRTMLPCLTSHSSQKMIKITYLESQFYFRISMSIKIETSSI